MDDAERREAAAVRKPAKARWLRGAGLGGILVVVAIALAMSVGLGGQRSSHPVIDEARATTIARAFFDGAHESGASLANVRILSVELGRDAAGHDAWKVNITGDVTEASQASFSYVSAMWLYVDAVSGEVTIFAQG